MKSSKTFQAEVHKENRENEKEAIYKLPVEKFSEIFKET